jgi:hypothetical protein
MDVNEGADKFWEYSDMYEESDIAEKLSRGVGIGVGIDLLNKVVVMGTPDGMMDMSIEMARAMSYALHIAADALQSEIAKSN